MEKIKGRYASYITVMVIAVVLAAPLSAFAGGPKSGGGNIAALVSGTPMEELSPAETAGLILMVQEEKLARDVYKVLFEKWNLRVFDNIGRSEQQHMDAVRALLAKYGLTDPTAGAAPGAFENEHLQTLYNDLTQQGSASLADALQVGATIEDLDIKDLEELLTKTDNKDISIVYQNLVKASRNHMRSFYGQLKGHGRTYEARFITAEDLARIIGSPRERGMVNERGEAN